MLPDLPQQHKDPEAHFGLVFRKWLKAHKSVYSDSCTFELKHTRGSLSLPYAALESAQIAYASAVSGDGELIRVTGTQGEPDYVWLVSVPAYIVIRYPTFWCIILVHDFVWERNMGKRKSLLAERAREIALTIVEV